MKQKILFNALNFEYEEVRELSSREINAAFRAVDDSNKWPVCGRFNATERAIRRIRRNYGSSHPGGLEYALLLQQEISDVVNGLV